MMHILVIYASRRTNIYDLFVEFCKTKRKHMGAHEPQNKRREYNAAKKGNIKKSRHIFIA